MPVIKLGSKEPRVDKSAFVADGAVIIGDVTVGANCSIWFKAVIRGDMNSITVGEYTNIQDQCVVHTPPDAAVTIGNNVTVGHRALVHGCRIADNCLIGMGAIIMNNAEIGENSIVAAGSLVTEGTKVPPGSLVLGSPARVKRPLRSDEIEWIKKSARLYFENSRKYI